MTGYFAFAFLLVILLFYSEITRRKGFEGLKIKRIVKTPLVEEGEEIKVTTLIENNKWIPISFLRVAQKIPLGISPGENLDSISLELSLGWYKRANSTLKLKGRKRGIYLLKNINITIGDVFGFTSESRDYEDYAEIVVYPKVTQLTGINVATNSVLGDNIIKRWIYKDPLYIRTIREYSVEDRMKDIHWPSSLKMNKLMVKDYDYTSDKELMVILNAQCGEPAFTLIKGDALEWGIKLAASLSKEAIDMGISTGMWTNAYVSAYSVEFKPLVEPALNSFNRILELCGRISFPPKEEFKSFLYNNARNFTKNTVYVVIACFLDDESASVLYKLKNQGINIKLIDISEDSSLPEVQGVEKLSWKGGDEDERH